MPLINLILNLVGMLLWVSWRYVPFDPIQRAKPATLTGTLRRAEPLKFRRWHFLLALSALLLLRSAFYWWVGGTMQWTLDVNLGVVSIAFRCDVFDRMLLFSFVSFANALFQFYLVLTLLWLCGPRNVDSDPCQRFVRIQITPFQKLPRLVLLFMPLVVASITWMALAPLMTHMKIIPAFESWPHLAEQSVVLGLGAYPLWKHVVGVVLGLHLLNTYVYLGMHPFWNYVSTLGKRLLKPIEWIPLQAMRMNFAPVVGICAAYGLGFLMERGLDTFFQKLPL